MNSARREPQGRTINLKRDRATRGASACAARVNLPFEILLSLDHVFSVIHFSGQAKFHTRVAGLRRDERPRPRRRCTFFDFEDEDEDDDEDDWSTSDFAT
jgi:hypothetical protein